MIRLIATFCYTGLAPVAPGTAGSLAALVAGYALHVLGGPVLLVAATAVAFFGGWWATARYTADGANPDPSEVVIDEVAGMWLALWPLSIGLWMAGADRTVFPWPGWVAAFVLFRAFDILKPGPVGWADRLHSPLGVMLDDLIAGAMAAVLVALLAWIAHGLMGA